MITAWTKHCKTEEEKAQFTQSIKRVRWVLDHLKGLLSQNETSILDQEMSPKAYDNPNWAYRQAHANGYKQALRDFNKLLTIEE